MKKFRQRILEIKEGFLDAKFETEFEAYVIANSVFSGIIGLAIIFSSTIFMLFDLECIAFTISIITLLATIFFLFYKKAFFMVMPITRKIVVHLFGRYGRAVTKKDWKNIKKYYPKGYKMIWSKKSFGHCYFYSWAIAQFLRDAELMYCSIKLKDGTDSGHTVIVKNNCVYDTNARRHFDLEEYKDMLEVNVYKMFSGEEYRNAKFFDNIREDFVKWCTERNVYCDPQ